MFPVPLNENTRLSSLSRLDIMDTEASTAFDRICQIAQEYFHVPIVIVSFVERERVWAKAKIGLRMNSIHRSDSFCSHTIMEDQVLVISDTLRDPRSVNNAFVTGQPHIRFYAGAAIEMSANVRVGAVCVLDTKPRSLSGAEKLVLKNLSDIAVSELRLLQAGRLARGMLAEQATAG